MATAFDKTQRLKTFVQWAHHHIRGDEKGEAQIFLDRLFQGFGWEGLKEAGAQCEERVKNNRGGTSFADLVWKPVVVIEMKKRGVDLAKHYSQAFTYWTRLVPDRPRYAVLCNFDEFWIYDFETQLDTPVDKIRLTELPERFGPLNFLYEQKVSPIFGNHQESVTRQAADKLSQCFNSLVARKIDQPLAQRFVLQMLMALFAQDIGLLDRYFVTTLLDECKSGQDTYDLLGGLFAAMDTKGGHSGGRYKGVAYFNGGLFANPARIELNAAERSLLKEAAQFKWSAVRPEIFGTIFEHSLGKEERHATGAHFTSPVDIMKVVGPTIVAPWSARVEAETSLKGLNELLVRLERFRVLDPACGSGNFLYVAYRELKRIEARIYERMATEFKSVSTYQRPFGFVSASAFFGQDINPFAIEIAKVTMMLAHKLSIDELHINEEALPLDNLNANFKLCDALIDDSGARTTWFDADVIIGNPPFLGAKQLKPEYGPDYVKKLRAAYPEVPGMADFCVYWFRRANDLLPECSVQDPFTGRAGLVGTQNIRNNASRIGGLDAIAASGTIIEAVENQPWSGEANVNVSIANWVKSKDAAVLPRKRSLWFQVASSKYLKVAKPKSDGPRSKFYELDVKEVAAINSALSDKVDLSKAAQLKANTSPQKCFTGQMLGHAGFLLDAGQRRAIVESDPMSAQVIYPYLNGDDALGGVELNRYVLDFEQRDQIEASKFKGAFAWARREVLPDRAAAAEDGKDEEGNQRPHHKAFLARWWQLSFGRAELLESIREKKRYIVCSRVTKRPIFFFVSSDVRPSDALSCFAFDDDYSYGVLQSSAHFKWFEAKSSKLTERLRYTPDSVFDTFAWPQTPTSKQVLAVAAAGRNIRKIRDKAVAARSGGLRAVYQALELPGAHPLRSAHDELDGAVLAAYGFSAKKDVLQQLLGLNAECAVAERAGQRVTAPGIPGSIKSRSGLFSDDNLRA